MSEFKIGHYTNLNGGTGCTVIVCPEGTKASACARGIAPGTREFALLSPFRKVEEIDGLLLTGGSAFGLDAAAGVMRYFAEQGRGHDTPFRKIPIVPAAVIYDLYMISSESFPVAEDAYGACRRAKSGNTAQGNVGVGTGATVGKWAGLEYAMKGGLGLARVEFNGIWVETLAVTNSVGDVIDGEGKILAGARKNGKFLAADDPKIRWLPREEIRDMNTVLAALMTNANLTKSQLYYLAERSHNGIVRTVLPAHTSFDGDVVFALSRGERPVQIDLITEMAMEATGQAIMSGVRAAESLGGAEGLKTIS